MNDIEKAIEEFKDRRGYYLDDKYRLRCYDLAISALRGGRGMEDIITKMKFSPVEIGKHILEKEGYTVDAFGFGYDSLCIIVKDADGKIVFEETHGS